MPSQPTCWHQMGPRRSLLRSLLQTHPRRRQQGPQQHMLTPHARRQQGALRFGLLLPDLPGKVHRADL